MLDAVHVCSAETELASTWPIDNLVFAVDFDELEADGTLCLCTRVCWGGGGLVLRYKSNARRCLPVLLYSVLCTLYSVL